MANTEQDVIDDFAAYSKTHAGKYLTFKINHAVYGLQILKVQEIIGLMRVTHVPRFPDYVRGVVNLRGKVIPVIVLREKLALPTADDTERTCIIVVQLLLIGERITMGLIVDEVSEVVDVVSEQIEPAPRLGDETDTAYILGMGKIDDSVVILLDVDRLLSSEELFEMQSAVTVAQGHPV